MSKNIVINIYVNEKFQLGMVIKMFVFYSPLQRALDRNIDRSEEIIVSLIVR